MNRLLPPSAGLGLRAPHVAFVLAERPSVPWFEVHSENYFADGGPALAALERVRADYPVSLHGVGLSLGSTDPLDAGHLAKLARLAERVEPARVSEHLCWSSVDGRHYNDLLPLPYTQEALGHVCARVSATQDFLRREILVENVSSYLTFPESTIPKANSWPQSPRAPAAGCWSTSTTSTSTRATTASMPMPTWPRFRPPWSRRSISRASTRAVPASSTRMARPWRRKSGRCTNSALHRYGRVPTLIEWDTDIPEFAVLQREAATAQSFLEACACRRCVNCSRASRRRCRPATPMAACASPSTATPSARTIGMRSARRIPCVAAGRRAVFPRRRRRLRRSLPVDGRRPQCLWREFGDFLACYPHAREPPYLPDVARLEWAMDEAGRAADAGGTPEAMLDALARFPPIGSPRCGSRSTRPAGC